MQERIDLSQLIVRPIKGKERLPWDRLMKEHHYLGFKEGITPYMRYSGLEDEIKAHIKVFKEQEGQRKERLQKRTIWLPGSPDPEYTPNLDKPVP